jgi:hypothetical protein
MLIVGRGGMSGAATMGRRENGRENKVEKQGLDGQRDDAGTNGRRLLLPECGEAAFVAAMRRGMREGWA